MNKKQFIEKLYSSINQKTINQELLSDENRFLRSNYLFNLINYLSKILNYFNYQNNIVFENNLPFIVIKNIKLMICNPYYLKNVEKKINLSFEKTENFLSKLNIDPKYILDLGACWGECSIYLSSIYKEAKVFSIEGALKNYRIFETNLKHNSKFSSNIVANHLIISNKNGYEGVNSLSTMTIRNLSLNIDKNEYEKVICSSLINYIKKHKIPNIDFLKIDIEGSELNIIDDLLIAPIRSMQIEIINYNSIDLNLEFLSKLSRKFYFHKPNTWNIINFNELKNLVTNHLSQNPALDVFLSKK